MNDVPKRRLLRAERARVPSALLEMGFALCDEMHRQYLALGLAGDWRARELAKMLRNCPANEGRCPSAEPCRTQTSLTAARVACGR